MARNLSHDSSAFVTEHSEIKKSDEVLMDGVKMEGISGAHGTGTTLPEKYSKFAEGSSEFNLEGNFIAQAAIGNTGPVQLNQTWQYFDKGSSQDTVLIKGGNFQQANIGGTATYNNEGGLYGKREVLKAEDLTVHILQKGVTCENLIKLLEKNYSLARIALSIPDNPSLRDRMINALLLK